MTSIVLVLGCAGDPMGNDPTTTPTVPVPEPVPTVPCSTIWYEDLDGDGLGAAERTACFAPPGFVAAGGDCDDTDPTFTGPVGPRRFVDVSEDAGLRGIGESWTGSNPCIHEALGGGAAVGDVDGDGDLDLFLPRIYLADQLLLNDGLGHFTVSDGLTGKRDGSNGALMVDVDGDRDLDIVVTSVGQGPNLLYVNDGTGVFDEQGRSRGIAFDPAPGCADQFGVSAADVDGDDDLDLFLAAWQEEDLVGETERSRLLLNDGTGRFADGTVAAGLDATWQRAVFGGVFADRDGDGDPDLHLIADWRGSGLFLNDGGRFAEVFDRGTFTDENGMGSDLGDVDGDGDLDWFVSSVWDPTVPCPQGWGCTGNRLYVDDGTGRFTDGTDRAGVRAGQWGWGTSFLDYDLDGNLDLVMTGGMAIFGFWTEPGRLWHGAGDGTFEDVTCTGGWVDRRVGRGVIPFDADGDGDPDLLVTGSEEAPSLWRNEGSEDRGSLVVTLDQPGANRFAIGASVTVRATTGGPSQLRAIEANAAFVSGRPPIASFGLGDHPRPAAEVVVVWPDGLQSIHRDIGPGRVVLLRP